MYVSEYFHEQTNFRQDRSQALEQRQHLNSKETSLEDHLIQPYRLQVVLPPVTSSVEFCGGASKSNTSNNVASSSANLSPYSLRDAAVTGSGMSGVSPSNSAVSSTSGLLNILPTVLLPSNESSRVSYRESFESCSSPIPQPKFSAVLLPPPRSSSLVSNGTKGSSNGSVRCDSGTDD